MPPAKLKIIRENQKINDLIATYIEQHASVKGEVRILEAGCGQRWPFDLKSIRYTLTGIDLDEDALEIRKKIQRDLDDTIVGDLRYADIQPNSYDIIYSSYVLEHIQGAELVLKNFKKWLKPDGLIILKFPNRDSVYGFFTRITPFCVHVWYKKYMRGMKNAGRPGFGPYPTFHDRVISRKVFHEFVEENELYVKEEYGFGNLPVFQKIFTKFVQILSFGALSANHVNLMYVLTQKRSG